MVKVYGKHLTLLVPRKEKYIGGNKYTYKGEVQVSIYVTTFCVCICSGTSKHCLRTNKLPQ